MRKDILKARRREESLVLWGWKKEDPEFRVILSTQGISSQPELPILKNKSNDETQKVSVYC